MNAKMKLAVVFCTAMLALGLYIDNRPAAPIDFKNPETLRYRNIYKHAQNNVAAAQYLLGTFYRDGYEPDNIIPDLDKSGFWLKKAADNGHPFASFDYAKLIYPSNKLLAENYYRKAMNLGFTAAIFALAQLKFHEATPEALKEGIELTYAAANRKDPMGQAYLATLLYEGAGVKKDRVEAVLTMQKAAANAPTPATKKEWTTTQEEWLKTFTQQEQEDLNSLLMLGSNKETLSGLKLSTLGTEQDIASLLSKSPIDSLQSTGK